MILMMLFVWLVFLVLRFARDTLLAWYVSARREVKLYASVVLRLRRSLIRQGSVRYGRSDFISSGFMRPRASVIILRLRPVGLGSSLGRQGAIRGCGLGV